jgi:hypothetical protein
MNSSVAKRLGLGLCLGLGIGWVVLRPETPSVVRPMVMSDTIVEPWDLLQGGGNTAPWWLKPNLDSALVVQPDRPHWRGEVEKQHQGEDTLKRTRSYRLSTSSQRLRNEEIGAKKPGVIRIVAIGDSVTHGWGVSRSESYPAQLESYLLEKGRKIEVINAGVPANRLENMEAWCRRVAVDLEVDWVLWTRRPVPNSQKPAMQYKKTLESCQKATGAKVLVVLPPISTFDVRGNQHYQQEGRLLRKALGQEVPVLELTDLFREAQKGRGVALVADDAKLNLVDQTTGSVLMALSPPPKPRNHNVRDHGPPLDLSVYAYFEDHLDVREALFFDEGHPDAEGFVLFAQAVGDALIGLWDADPKD